MEMETKYGVSALESQVILMFKYFFVYSESVLVGYKANKIGNKILNVAFTTTYGITHGLVWRSVFVCLYFYLLSASSAQQNFSITRSVDRLLLFSIHFWLYLSPLHLFKYFIMIISH